jgi:crossover junction endodeoxyribonuclease RuvC
LVVSVVLGIDPGLAATGYGVLAVRGSRVRRITDGVIRTPAGADHGSRLLTLSNRLRAIVTEYRPDEAAIEELFFSKNVRTAFPVAQARGVIILVLAQCGVPFSEYSPGTVKLAVAGHSRAPKGQIIRSVRLVLGLADEPDSDHGADALAIALCHVQHAPVRAAVARAGAAR